MSNTFDWIEIEVRDVARTARFYERLFGWKVTRKETADGSDVWLFDTGAWPRVENLRRGGIWSRPEGESLGVVVYVVVDDIASTLDRAKELGAVVITPRTPQGSAYRARLADPDGNRIGLWEERQGGEEEIPAEMVLISGGAFLMGAGTEEDYSPVHEVTISTFYMDRYEVTNAQYLRFCEETGHRLPDFWGMSGFRCGPRYPNHPVVGVSSYDASLYAEWGGKRLPTEAEWEYAARGGLTGMRFPTGDMLEPSDGNFNRSGQGGPVAVGSYPANGFGLHDMQGNVVEWVADYYDAAYYVSSPRIDPQGPQFGRYRVIRGGGWHSGASCNQVFWRHALPASWVDFNVGFRCARDAE